MDTVKEKVERYKVLAEMYLHEDKRVFIKDLSDNYYFADILFVGEDRLTIDCFAPEHRIGKHYLPWASILSVDEYREERE